MLPAVAEYVEEVFASLSVEERQQLAALALLETVPTRFHALWR